MEECVFETPEGIVSVPFAHVEELEHVFAHSSTRIKVMLNRFVRRCQVHRMFNCGSVHLCANRRALVFCNVASKLAVSMLQKYRELVVFGSRAEWELLADTAAIDRGTCSRSHYRDPAPLTAAVYEATVQVTLQLTKDQVSKIIGYQGTKIAATRKAASHAVIKILPLARKLSGKQARQSTQVVQQVMVSGPESSAYFALSIIESQLHALNCPSSISLCKTSPTSNMHIQECNHNAHI